MFKHYNANVKGNNVSDCVVRAISLAEGESWKHTYRKLSMLAEEKGTLLDDVDFVESYLDDRYPRQAHLSKTVGEFSEECKKGIYLVTMPGHITCIIKGKEGIGVIYDTFDPSQRRMWCAWKVA